MNKEEILRKVEQREYEKRCVDAGICPECGADLSIDGDDNLLDKVCRPCNLSWPYV